MSDRTSSQQRPVEELSRYLTEVTGEPVDEPLLAVSGSASCLGAGIVRKRKGQMTHCSRSASVFLPTEGGTRQAVNAL